MARFLARRLAFLVLTLLFTSMLVFAVTQLLPGDVARIVLGREAGEEALVQFRQEWGLTDPLPVQYGRWLGGFVTGDWGASYTADAIRPIVMARLGNSLMLAGFTLLLAVPLGVLLGVLAGLHEGRVLDTVISVGTLAVVGLPEFVTGLALIQIFAHALDALPASSPIRTGTPFLQALPSLVLPAVTAMLVMLGYVARLTRAQVVEELRRPYVRTAVLKGLSWRRVVLRHVLRNALLPTVTVVAISFGWLIGGIIVIENVFNYPGLGRLLLFAIDRRDFPLLSAISMVVVLGVLLANLTADLLYAWLNPRIRLE